MRGSRQVEPCAPGTHPGGESGHEGKGAILVLFVFSQVKHDLPDSLPSRDPGLEERVQTAVPGNGLQSPHGQAVPDPGQHIRREVLSAGHWRGCQHPMRKLGGAGRLYRNLLVRIWEMTELGQVICGQGPPEPHGHGQIAQRCVCGQTEEPGSPVFAKSCLQGAQGFGLGGLLFRAVQDKPA